MEKHHKLAIAPPLTFAALYSIFTQPLAFITPKMRLLNTETLKLRQFDQEPFPEYAILSHRWGDQEVSFQELEAGLGTEKDGYQKITTFCAKARNRGFKWCWVDTCGIDKTSSAELSEAINSMYKWYEMSAVCFVYLPDVTAQILRDGSFSFRGFGSSSWFTRGWTLQELIAPHCVEFYNSEWIYVSDKLSRADKLSDITGVDEGVLLGTSPVRASSIAKIMSWASKRVTTRKEDTAYCLLGLFGIHMPLLYGEGERAFIRLQEEILKQPSDQSLFAWNPVDEASNSASSKKDPICGIFAPSPACFAETGDIVPLPGYWDTESTLTNRGVRLRMPFKCDKSNNNFIGILCCVSGSLIRDVAIDFHSASHSLEDLDHLIRRSLPVRYGNWSNDRQVQFNQVYLATETSLWHARYYGLRFLKTEFEFHVIVRDPHSLAVLDGTPELYPPGALIDDPSVTYKDTKKGKRIVVLNPLKAGHNRIAMLLPAVFSQNVALVFGFRTLQSGLPDVRQTWNVVARMHKNQTLAEVWSDVKEPPPSKSVEASKITIDGVCISVEIGQQSWWARASRNILISFSLEEANSKVDEWSKIPKDDPEDDAQDHPAIFIMGITGAGKSQLIRRAIQDS